MRKFFRNYGRKLSCAILIALSAMSNASAATTTANFNVTATVGATCSIGAITDLAFGPYNSAATTQSTTTISITCTNSTTYTIGLSGGIANDVSNRTMKLTGGSDLLHYSLKQTSQTGNNWGNTPSNDTVGGTGSGVAQSYTVYGTLPNTQTPPPSPGNYSDTIQVTVTF